MLPRLENDLLVCSDNRAKDDQILVSGQRKFRSEGHALTWGFEAGDPAAPAPEGPVRGTLVAESHQDGGDPVLTASGRVVGCNARVRQLRFCNPRNGGVGTCDQLAHVSAYLCCRISWQRRAGEQRRAGDLDLKN